MYISHTLRETAHIPTFIIMNQQTRIKFFRIMLIENKFSIYESE